MAKKEVLAGEEQKEKLKALQMAMGKREKSVGKGYIMK